MAGTLKKVRFKLSWQNYRVGDEITPNASLRDWLLGNGYVEVVDDPSPVRAQGVNRQTQPTSRRAARGA
jgi:hypothetical protein